MNLAKTAQNNILTLFAAAATFLNSSNKALADFHFSIGFRSPIVIGTQPAVIVEQPAPPPAVVVPAQPSADMPTVGFDGVQGLASRVGVQTIFPYAQTGYSQVYIQDTGESFGFQYNLSNGRAELAGVYNLNSADDKKRFDDAVYNSSIRNTELSNWNTPYQGEWVVFVPDNFVCFGFFFDRNCHDGDRRRHFEQRRVNIPTREQHEARANNLQQQRTAQGNVPNNSLHHDRVVTQPTGSLPNNQFRTDVPSTDSDPFKTPKLYAAPLHPAVAPPVSVTPKNPVFNAPVRTPTFAPPTSSGQPTHQKLKL